MSEKTVEDIDAISGTRSRERAFRHLARQLERELTQAQARCAEVEKVAAEFLARHDAIEPALREVFTFYAVHGMKWPEDDNWKRELDALRDALKEPR